MLYAYFGLFYITLTDRYIIYHLVPESSPVAVISLFGLVVGRSRLYSVDD